MKKPKYNQKDAALVGYKLYKLDDTYFWSKEGTTTGTILHPIPPQYTHWTDKEEYPFNTTANKVTFKEAEDYLDKFLTDEEKEIIANSKNNIKFHKKLSKIIE